MPESEGYARVHAWLHETWPDVPEIEPFHGSTGRDSYAWDVYLKGFGNGPPFRVEVSGPLMAHVPSLEKELAKAGDLRAEIEATAPGTVFISTKGIQLQALAE